MTPPPPEWAPVDRIFTAWPWRKKEWRGALYAAQAQTAALVAAIARGGTRVTLLVPDQKREQQAAALIGDVGEVTFVRMRYGDIWLRDTGPMFAGGVAHAFGFNGWGEKYEMPGDERVAAALAKRVGAALRRHDFVFEGGAIDHDGAGNAITTEQCLLNPNRNGDIGKSEMEAKLRDALGFETIVWLGEGLANDHTDGHVDNLARFVAERTVVVPEAMRTDDPNAAIYADAAERLLAAGFEVVRIPSPGRIDDGEGRAMPASYMNFILTNERVIVPTYGQVTDETAVAALGSLFPGREAIGLDARAILTGGGAFHCMTHEVPA